MLQTVTAHMSRIGDIQFLDQMCNSNCGIEEHQQSKCQIRHRVVNIFIDFSHQKQLCTNSLKWPHAMMSRTSFLFYIVLRCFFMFHFIFLHGIDITAQIMKWHDHIVEYDDI